MVHPQPPPHDIPNLQADTFVEYLDAFQREQELDGKMRYCHTVTSIAPAEPDAADGARFILKLNVQAQCTKANGWDGILNLDTGEPQAETHRCGVLLMADGMWKPTDPESEDNPWMEGTDLTLPYDSLRTVDDSELEDKKIIILGCGNAAFETADAVRNFASDIVVLCRGHPKPLEKSRYVGNLRGPRTMTLDTTQLKSLESFVDSPPAVPKVERRGRHRHQREAQAKLDAHPDKKPEYLIPLTQLAVVPCGHAKAFSAWPDANVDKPTTGFRDATPRCIFEKDPDSGMVMLGWADIDTPQLAAMHRLFAGALVIKKAPKWIQTLYAKTGREINDWTGGGGGGGGGGGEMINGGKSKHLLFKSPVTDEERKWDVMMLPYAELRKPNLSAAQLALIAECTALTKGLQRRGYELDKSFDLIISSLGWVYDDAAFKAGGIDLALAGLQSKEARPRTKVYPDLSPTHKSTNVDHVYFIGANAHGIDRDRYKASGGFVHGFRYTTRSVFRTLESTYEGEPRPGVTAYPYPQPSKAYTDAMSAAAGGFDNSYKPAEHFSELLHDPLWKKFLSRVMFSAASYEMVGGALVDGIVFDANNQKSLYLEEVPEDLVHDNFNSSARLTFGFYTGGAAPQIGGEHWSQLRMPEQAPAAHPFRAVLEFWPSGTGLGQIPPAKGQVPFHQHPSSVFHPARRSARFHFKADRLTDYSNFAQVPLLDLFLRDVEATVAAGAARLHRQYHEQLDVSQGQGPGPGPGQPGQ